MTAKKILMISIVLFVLVLHATAFTFQPMFVRLDPTGPGKVQTFEIRNEGDQPLAVKLSIFTRFIMENGDEKNEDASSLFTIYPPRLVVEPRSSASVKLQWNGSDTLEFEQSFRLIAESVAIETETTVNSGIKLVFRYIASIYVGLATYTPNLVCTVTGANDLDGTRGFSVEIINTGKAHIVLDSARLEINGLANTPIIIEEDRLGHLSGQNYLPGIKRIIFIPIAEAITGRNYGVQLYFEPVF